jgi:hypothetical protein
MSRLSPLALVATLAFVHPLTAAAAGPPTISVTVTAEAVCTEGGAAINFTVAGTNGPHTNVDVSFNGVKVFDGSFSGSAGQLDQQFSGSAPAPAGSVVVTAEAVGPWANGDAGGQSGSATVDVPDTCTSGDGRFTGGGRQLIAGGAKVTRGLTIHCDLRLSNNLEINWGGGNHFHMTQHTAATCFDSEVIDQRPPVAPLDTLVGVGTGKFNGVDGYTVEFTLVDAGEPGSSDMMAIRIFETANPANVVLNVPLQLLNDGNLQAHYDQPHRTR